MTGPPRGYAPDFYPLPAPTAPVSRRVVDPIADFEETMIEAQLDTPSMHETLTAYRREYAASESVSLSAFEQDLHARNAQRLGAVFRSRPNWQADSSKLDMP